MAGATIFYKYLKPMKYLYIIILSSLFVLSGAVSTSAGIAINEFCYYADPSGDTGQEWIELYNSDSLVRDISGWDLYPSRTPHFIIPAGVSIAPKSYLLVYLRKDGVNTISEIYEGTADVSSNMPNTRGSIALFTSNVRDTIIDFVQYGDDSMTYEATAANADLWTRGFFVDTTTFGWSLGLTTDGADSNRPVDWSEFAKPSPGYSNLPYPVDIAVSDVTISPDEPEAGQALSLSAEILNMGLDTAFSPEIIVFEDADCDSIVDNSETRLGVIKWNFLSDTRTATVQINGLSEGQYNLAIAISCSNESYLRNNYKRNLLTVGGPIIINEIMFFPLSGQAEWIEFYNRSTREVNINGWTIEDNQNEPSRISQEERIIFPNEYFIVTSIANQPLTDCLLLTMSGFPALNDDGDIVRIRDINQREVDMVQYLPDWGKAGGKSLEKVNPALISNTSSSWGLCLEALGSTPGKKNSIYLNCSPGTSSIMAGPNPFSPDGDGHEDRTILNYNLPWRNAIINISIYDRLGRQIRSIINNGMLPATGSMVWDGKADDGRPCPMGIYLVLLEAKDYDGAGTIKAKATVAVAKKLK